LAFEAAVASFAKTVKYFIGYFEHYSTDYHFEFIIIMAFQAN